MNIVAFKRELNAYCNLQNLCPVVEYVLKSSFRAIIIVALVNRNNMNAQSLDTYKSLLLKIKVIAIVMNVKLVKICCAKCILIYP